MAVALVASAVFVVAAIRDAWTVLRSDIAPGSKHVVAAAPAARGFVALGFVPTDDSADAVAWHVDGTEWKEIGARLSDRMFNDAVVIGDRVLIAGSLRGLPAIFETSLSGGSDMRVAWRATDVTDTGELTAIVATPDSITAVGSTMSDRGRDAVSVTAMSDSGRWSSATIEDGAWITSAAVDGDGTVLAGGQVEGSTTAAVWTRSATGPWIRELLPADGARRSFAVAIAAGTGLPVVVGQVDTNPAAWVRQDTGWHAVHLPAEGPGHRVTSVDVAATGEFLAAGTAVGLGDTTRPLAWKSRDGVTWRRVGASGATHGGIAAVTAKGERLVAWGNSQERKRIRPDVQELTGDVLEPAEP